MRKWLLLSFLIILPSIMAIEFNNNNVLPLPQGKLNCKLIYGGNDTDFCTDRFNIGNSTFNGFFTSLNFFGTTGFSDFIDNNNITWAGHNIVYRNNLSNYIQNTSLFNGTWIKTSQVYNGTLTKKGIQNNTALSKAYINGTLFATRINVSSTNISGNGVLLNLGNGLSMQVFFKGSTILTRWLNLSGSLIGIGPTGSISTSIFRFATQGTSVSRFDFVNTKGTEIITIRANANAGGSSSGRSDISCINCAQVRIGDDLYPLNDALTFPNNFGNVSFRWGTGYIYNLVSDRYANLTNVTMQNGRIAKFDQTKVLFNKTIISNSSLILSGTNANQFVIKDSSIPNTPLIIVDTLNDVIWLNQSLVKLRGPSNSRLFSVYGAGSANKGINVDTAGGSLFVNDTLYVQATSNSNKYQLTNGSTFDSIYGARGTATSSGILNNTLIGKVYLNISNGFIVDKINVTGISPSIIGASSQIGTFGRPFTKIFSNFFLISTSGKVCFVGTCGAGGQISDNGTHMILTR